MIKFLLSALLFLPLPSAIVKAEDSAEQLKLDYENLRGIGFDLNRHAVVENIVLKRHSATFHLIKGELFFLEPVTINGKEHTTGVIFIGKGSFEFFPGTEMEKKQMVRLFKKQTYVDKFKTLVLRFSDSTGSELAEGLELQPVKVKRATKEVKNRGDKFLYEDDNIDMIYLILESIITNRKEKLFYAHMDGGRNKPIFYIENPLADEDISFLNRYSSLYKFRQTICKFPRDGDYTYSRASDVKRLKLSPIHYKLEADITKKGLFTASMEMHLKVLDDSVKTALFWLNEELEVTEILDSKGRNIPFSRYKDSSDLILFFNSPLNKGTVDTLYLKYSGKILVNRWNGFYIKERSIWYPRNVSHEPTTFDMTYTVPKNFQFFSVGEMVEEKKGKKTITSRWVQNEPIWHNSFNIGIFKTYEMNEEGVIPITVLMSKRGHYELSKFISRDRNMEKEVGFDIANAVRYFEYLFGEFPYDRLYATEVPQQHGISFPGLLHLSWWTFHQRDRLGHSEVFRAHEVAHQWWGNSVRTKTYHDAWLSEGFATYAGLWYMQTVLKDNDKFFDLLDEYRDEIFAKRDFGIFGSRPEASPIWFGTRASSSKTKGDYSLIIYKKGAYVLHMLRNMMLDLKTMKDDRFINLLRDFYAQSKGKQITTEDFKRIVEKHMQADMSWFFDQWVYGSSIPTYRFSYKSNKTPEGKYLVSCKVIQENVPDDFVMFVPLTIIFDDNRKLHLRTLINKPVNEFDLPLLTMKPKKIEFNSLNSVLAKVKYD